MGMILLSVVARTLLAIVAMFLLTKMLGKRQLSEMSLFGYISGISIGNIAAYIALEDDELWGYALTSLILWVVVTIILEKSTLKSKFMRNIIDSDRRLLISKGVVMKEALKKERMTVNELLEQLRDKDVFRVADVENASIEANGDLSVYLKPEFLPVTLSILGIKPPVEQEPITFIVDGSIEFDALHTSGYDQKWLEKQLDKANLKPSDVFIGQFVDERQLSIHTIDSKQVDINCSEDQSENSQSNETDEMQKIKKTLLQAIAIIEQYSEYLNKDKKKG